MPVLFSMKRIRIEYDEIPCPKENLEGPCYIVRGHRHEKWYCRFRFHGKSVRIHRYIWEKSNGPIPGGLEVDHQCRNRACCNVNHLRIVTHQINVTENIVGVNWQLQLAKTHCPKGHPYDATNTYVNPFTKVRHCRECRRDFDRRAYHAKKAATMRAEGVSHH